MKNETLLRKLYAVKEAPHNTKALDDLITEIKLEMTLETAPRYTGNYIKAAAKFAKYCRKETRRECLQGAFRYNVGAETRQGICDGYVAVAYDKPIEGLMEIADSIQPIDLEKIFSHNKGPEMEIMLPSYTEIKKAFAIEKADKMSRKWQSLNGKMGCTVRIGNGAVFNAEYLMRALELADLTGTEAVCAISFGGTALSSVFLENDVDGNHIRVLIMPIRTEITGAKRDIDIVDLWKSDAKIAS